MKNMNLFTLITAAILIAAGFMSQPSNADSSDHACDGQGWTTCTGNRECERWGTLEYPDHCVDCNHDGRYHLLGRITTYYNCEALDGTVSDCAVSRIRYGQECTP